MSAERPWFVIAGGGTGGHLYPGLAVMDSVRRFRPDAEVTVFGTPRRVDGMLVEPRKHELVRQEVRAFTARPWRWPGFWLACQQAYRLQPSTGYVAQA